MLKIKFWLYSQTYTISCVFNKKGNVFYSEKYVWQFNFAEHLHPHFPNSGSVTSFLLHMLYVTAHRFVWIVRLQLGYSNTWMTTSYNHAQIVRQRALGHRYVENPSPFSQILINTHKMQQIGQTVQKARLHWYCLNRKMLGGLLL